MPMYIDFKISWVPNASLCIFVGAMAPVAPMLSSNAPSVFLLSKNNAIVNEIEGSSTVEYKTIRQTLAEQRGRLEEFNLLCNNVEASLKAFWSR